MDRLVTLQKYGTTLHADTNEPIPGVLEEHKVWAEFYVLRGVEEHEGYRRVNTNAARCLIRYRADVNAEDWKVKDENARIWDIIAVPREIGRRAGLELTLERKN